MKYQATIHYSGQLEAEDGEKSHCKRYTFNLTQLVAFKSPVYKDRNIVNQNTIYVVKDKKAVQSKIYIFREGTVLKKRPILPFLSFQQLLRGRHEFHRFSRNFAKCVSYAYSAYSYFDYDLSYPEKPGYLFSHIATQSDKTEEALGTFYSLIDSMPIKT